jgi:hypothetical protein
MSNNAGESPPWGDDTIRRFVVGEASEHYYQINYTLTDVDDDAAYFHVQFRRTNPLPYKQPYTIVDGIRGAGQYVGTVLAWGVNNNGWWGEGEIKFYCVYEVNQSS